MPHKPPEQHRRIRPSTSCYWNRQKALPAFGFASWAVSRSNVQLVEHHRFAVCAIEPGNTFRLDEAQMLALLHSSEVNWLLGACDGFLLFLGTPTERLTEQPLVTLLLWPFRFYFGQTTLATVTQHHVPRRQVETPEKNNQLARRLRTAGFITQSNLRLNQGANATTARTLALVH